ncbi:MAG: glycogen-binding domain-containing protein [Phycisphaerae bacterium]
MAKQQSQTAETTLASTRIVCSAPHAHEIVLTGTFNDWDPAALPMTRNADGQWSADLQLPPGRYEYKFVVDGVSCCEPHLRSDHGDCGDRVLNRFGTVNRVLVVR